MKGKDIRLSQVKTGNEISPSNFNQALDRTARAVEDLDSRISEVSKASSIRDIGELTEDSAVSGQSDGFVTYLLNGSRKFAIIYNGERHQL